MNDFCENFDNRVWCDCDYCLDLRERDACQQQDYPDPKDGDYPD